MMPAVFLLPIPGAFDKFFAPEFFARHFLGFQKIALHHELRGDAGVVGARHPERGNAFHAVIADHQIFHADEHGVTEMQFAGHIRAAGWK